MSLQHQGFGKQFDENVPGSSLGKLNSRDQTEKREIVHTKLSFPWEKETQSGVRDQRVNKKKKTHVLLEMAENETSKKLTTKMLPDLDSNIPPPTITPEPPSSSTNVATPIASSHRVVVLPVVSSTSRSNKRSIHQVTPNDDANTTTTSPSSSPSASQDNNINHNIVNEVQHDITITDTNTINNNENDDDGMDDRINFPSYDPLSTSSTITTTTGFI